MKPIKFTLLVTTLAASFVLCLSTAGWGNYYKKGRHICSDFQKAERLHRANPTEVDDEIAYAACLSLHGDPAKVIEGMNRFHHILNTTEHVFAALFIAEFIESGGDFEIPIDIDKINEAILAYGKVLAIINSHPRYPRARPIGYRVYEKYHQMELRAYYHIPMLYRDKFSTGFKGLHHEHLLTSSSYKGNRNLRTYPNYRLYTQDSLNKVIESADRCLALPKKWYHNTKRYEFNRKVCQVLKGEAITLRPLEDKRLVLLATESCKRDLPICREYNELYQKMDDIKEKSFSKLKNLSETYQVSL